MPWLHVKQNNFKIIISVSYFTKFNWRTRANITSYETKTNICVSGSVVARQLG